MKMSDIGFQKPNQTDLKIQKLATLFLQFGFQNTTSVVWGQFFTLSQSVIHSSSSIIIGST